MNNELLINNIKSNNSELKSYNEEKQIIEEMAEVLKDYTARNHIMASHVILDCYAEELYSKNYRKQSENTTELPCKLGDKVWCIYNYTKPKEFRITTITISENHYAFVIEADRGIYKHYCDKDSVGKYVFFIKEEAEQALAKKKGGAE